MPDPSDYEDKDAFVSDCVSTKVDEGMDQDQAVAACESMWEENVNANRGSCGCDGNRECGSGTRPNASESTSHTSPVVNVGTDVREETFEGRDYRVVPVVMAVGDAVMNGAYVPAPELARSVPAWNARPLPVDHPEMNGQPISANSPDILEKRNVGHLFNVEFSDNKLKGELWIDVVKANETAPEVITKVDAGELEVSTAYFSADEPKSGTLDDGTQYHVVHHALLPDHLALLPDAKGACSWEDGCGAPRTNRRENSSWLRRMLDKVTGNARSPDGELDSRELETRLMNALESELDKPVFVETVFYQSNQVVYEVLGDLDDPPQLKMRSYEIDDDGNASFGDDVQDVNRVVSFEPVSNESDDGDGEQPPAATQTANQGETDMDERIKGLIENENAPFTEDDAETLQAFSNDKLDGLVAKFNEGTSTDDGGGDGGDAGTGTDDGSGAPETVEAFVERAPEGLREPLQAMLRDHEAKRNRLIEAITANSANVFSKEELATFSDAYLDKLAKLADTNDDYSGQAVHAHGGAAAGQDDEPYEAPTLSARLASKKEG